MTRRPLEIIGQRFGRLTVTRDSGRRDSSGTILWRCLCDCGRMHQARGWHLKRGRVRSCGCLRVEANRTRLARMRARTTATTTGVIS